MIDKNSTPIDLAYDELLRVLYRMEDLARSDRDVPGKIIDVLIDAMGMKSGFVASMNVIYNELEESNRGMLLSALYGSVELSEASIYLSKGVDDAPSNAYVIRAKSLISNAIIVLGSKHQDIQLEMFPAMAA